MINLKSSINTMSQKRIKRIRYVLLYEDSLNFLFILLMIASALICFFGANITQYNGLWLSTRESAYIIWIGLIIFSIWNWYWWSWKTRKTFSNNILFQLPHINEMLKLRSYFFLLATFYYFSKKQLILKEIKFIENNIVSNNFGYSKNLKILTIDRLNFISVLLMVLGASFAFSSYPKEGNIVFFQNPSALTISGSIIGFLGFVLFLVMFLITCYIILRSKNKWWIKLIFMIPFIHLFSFYITFSPNYEFCKTEEINISK